MTLKEWLKINRWNVSAFSALIGYSRCHVQGVKDGKLNPGKGLREVISRVTNGEVQL